jgi:predicted nucleotidyltransferase
MLEKDNTAKVLELFFNDPLPDGGFQLRELSRAAKIAPLSVKMHLKQLEKEGLVAEKKHRVNGYPLYYADQESSYFRLLKWLHTVRALTESGLLDYLDRSCMPDVIMLFGSASRGEDLAGSDIDLYLQCREKQLILGEYEKKLKRGLRLLFEKDFDKLSPELKRNIINGIGLKGYLNL